MAKLSRFVQQNMRKLTLLLLVLFLFSNKLLAQEELIGKKKQTVDSVMNAGQNKSLGDGLATDTQLPYSTYKYKTGQIAIFYYDGKNNCTQCAVIYKKEELDNLLQKLDENFTKQEDGNIWTRNDNKMKVEMMIQKSIVAVKYISL